MLFVTIFKISLKTDDILVKIWKNSKHLMVNTKVMGMYVNILRNKPAVQAAGEDPPLLKLHQIGYIHPFSKIAGSANNVQLPNIYYLNISVLRTHRACVLIFVSLR